MARPRRDETGAEAPRRERRQCDCGSAVLASGRCEETGAYPASLAACPIACPLCRRPLSWDGGCLSCFGTTTPKDRTTWTFPGDRYEPQGPHMVKLDGPRHACARSESQAAFALLASMLEPGGPDRAAGLELLETILAAHPPLAEAPEEWEPGADG